ncbi:MAG TPA: DUF4956 domain-containing protein [Bacillota bacterium]|nr:DUF4956 domain-containing protein [Bacillota bacterium]HOK69533.1 DUF4956 domain-containing protein [Bacillota bacterium]HPP85933.1 DUF4956 domain-containing protein [Bacillota bacterium]
MSIFDAIKKSVLEGFSSEITVADIFFSVGVAFIAGLFILLIYRLTYKGVSFSRSFEGTLLMVCTTSALIVLSITSNLALSLGMVGALSIVRFRTAIKDASDTAFMFWAVAAGITAGAHYYILTLVGSLLIGFLTFLSLKIIGNYDPSFLLIVRAKTDTALEYAAKMLSENGFRYRLTSINSTADYNEAIYEISVGSRHSKLVSALKKIPDVTDVNLVDCRNSPV